MSRRSRNFRLNWLNDRLAAARTAALVLDAAPSGMVPEDLARDILTSIGAQAVVMKTGQTTASARDLRNAAAIHREFDMREVLVARRDRGRLSRLLTDHRDHILRVVGAAPRDGEFIEIVHRRTRRCSGRCCVSPPTS